MASSAPNKSQKLIFCAFSSGNSQFSKRIVPFNPKVHINSTPFLTYPQIAWESLILEYRLIQVTSIPLKDQITIKDPINYIHYPFWQYVFQKTGKTSFLQSSIILESTSLYLKCPISLDIPWIPKPISVFYINPSQDSVILPCLSNTLTPFSKTTLIIHVFKDTVYFIDPGANSSNPQFIQLVNHISKRIKKCCIILTHCHFDHIESLPVLLDLWPGSIVYTGPYTLKSDITRYFPLNNKIESLFEIQDITQSLKPNQILSKSTGKKFYTISNNWSVFCTPGHTKGHISCFHSKDSILYLGDHIVGHGSTVLDPCCKGNLNDYLETSHFLSKNTDFFGNFAIPSHGAFCFDLHSKLENVIAHRLKRKSSVLESCLSLKPVLSSLDIILEQVYPGLDPQLHPFAKKNIILTLEYLAEINEISNSWKTIVVAKYVQNMLSKSKLP